MHKIFKQNIQRLFVENNKCILYNRRVRSEKMTKLLKICVRTGSVAFDVVLLPLKVLITCAQILHNRIRYKTDTGDQLREKLRSYVPNHILDQTVLAVLETLAYFGGLSPEEADTHLQKNTDVWETKEYAEKMLDHQGKYIEHQQQMGRLQYGTNRPALDKLLFGDGKKLSGSMNTCEVIAVYNVLVALGGGASPVTFPELLAKFEQKGMILGGYFGTSPDYLEAYLKREHEVKTFTGRRIKEAALGRLADEYTAYIMTVYNDRNDITKQIHTMCITKEDGNYRIHNGEKGKNYATLSQAVSGYNEGKGKAICVMGIR